MSAASRVKRQFFYILIFNRNYLTVRREREREREREKGGELERERKGELESKRERGDR